MLPTLSVSGPGGADIPSFPESQALSWAAKSPIQVTTLEAAPSPQPLLGRVGPRAAAELRDTWVLV